jgi:hypothetical protein
MRCNLIFFAVILSLCCSAAARGKQASAAQVSPQTENPNTANTGSDCSVHLDAPQIANQTVDHDQRASQGLSDPGGESEEPAPAPVAVHLEQDLKNLDQRLTGLAQCILVVADQQGPGQGSPGACLGELLLKFEMRHNGDLVRDIPIGRLPGTLAFFYESGMTIDADGAPNAYHPDNTGLDDLKNAGAPGRWEGLAKDADGEPYIQGPDDPFPGYYVSETALADRSKPVNDPARYVDASKIPFVVLPGGMARQLGARPGDFATVFNQRNGRSSYAIFGDVGPYDRIGEGSVALAENLGIRSDARDGGARRGILYIVFPGSGNGRPRMIEEINAEGQQLLQGWESSMLLNACAGQQPARGQEGTQGAN